jgi:hypothetical protein
MPQVLHVVPGGGLDVLRPRCVAVLLLIRQVPLEEELRGSTAGPHYHTGSFRESCLLHVLQLPTDGHVATAAAVVCQRLQLDSKSAAAMSQQSRSRCLEHSCSGGAWLACPGQPEVHRTLAIHHNAHLHLLGRQLQRDGALEQRPRARRVARLDLLQRHLRKGLRPQHAGRTQAPTRRQPPKPPPALLRGESSRTAGPPTTS